ncbi:hypothetical protein KIN20_020045 [Parelaphostrongylus tenuis]|uniref:Uncharacterized protein n=1 Tax=Parelaphostrongylus tenuis TaxID=148309 RepID=A0AAD5QTA2_PARTN|nr:hypothetical protein KIN20_020045 [Parelaphostrongylus tenuis]
MKEALIKNMYQMAINVCKEGEKRKESLNLAPNIVISNGYDYDVPATRVISNNRTFVIYNERLSIFILDSAVHHKNTINQEIYLEEDVVQGSDVSDVSLSAEAGKVSWLVYAQSLTSRDGLSKAVIWRIFMGSNWTDKKVSDVLIELRKQHGDSHIEVICGGGKKRGTKQAFTPDYKCRMRGNF